MKIKVIVGLIMVAWLAPVQAQSWTNTSSGLWQDGVNWSTGVAPTSGGNAVITNGVPQVTINAATPIANLTNINSLILKNPVTLLLLSSNSTPLTIPSGLSDTFNNNPIVLDAGNLVTTNSTHTGLDYVSFWNNGSMTISNGGTWMSDRAAFGQSAVGTLTIVGSTNVFNNYLSLGSTAAGSGTVLLNGGLLVTTNSISGNPSVIVGYNGNGKLTVSNGTWLAGVVSVAGNSGVGTVNIDGGTSVISSNLVMGGATAGIGVLNVTAGNLAITNRFGIAQLVVGQTGKGTLTLKGGTMTVDQFLVTNGVKSIVNFSNGVLNTRATVFNNGSAFTVGNGTSNAVFSLLGGTHSFANGLIVNTNATLLLSDINVASSLGAVTNQGLFNIASGSWRPGAGSVAAGSGVLRVDSGGVLDLTNGSFTVGNTVTNLGTMRMFNGTVTYNQNVVNQGAYVSDPSTNTFNGNFTVDPTATVVAAANDIYAFGSNFVMQSTNRAFNMSTAVAYFGNTNYGITTGTTNHTLNLAGSGAVDMGSNWLNHTQLATNFSIGTLTIALSNRLTVTGDHLTNALYVGVLDLSAWNTNAGTSLTNTLETALSLPTINLYYDKYDANNAYLQGVEYNLWGGGGLLIPIPEPSALTLTLVAGMAMLAMFRRRA